MYSLSRRSAFRLVLLVAASPLLTSIPSVATETPLAIKGYDPVAYFTDGKPTRGTPEFEYQWDEHRYRFASAEHRDFSRPIPCATRRNSEITARWRWPWASRRGQPGKLADQRRQALCLRLSRPRKDPSFSRRILPETSPRQIRTGRSFRSTSGQRPAGRFRERPALRMPSRRCSRSAALRNLVPNSCGRMSGRGGGSSSRHARHPRSTELRIGGRQHDTAEIRAEVLRRLSSACSIAAS